MALGAMHALEFRIGHVHDRVNDGSIIFGVVMVTVAVGAGSATQPWRARSTTANTCPRAIVMASRALVGGLEAEMGCVALCSTRHALHLNSDLCPLCSVLGQCVVVSGGLEVVEHCGGTEGAGCRIEAKRCLPYAQHTSA
jgi:hypothetical protein